jgi:hypothetical protein
VLSCDTSKCTEGALLRGLFRIAVPHFFLVVDR